MYLIRSGAIQGFDRLALRLGQNPVRLLQAVGFSSAQVRQPNAYVVVWDGTNDRGAPVASGVYFYRMTAGSFSQVNKMMLLK